MVKNAIRQPKLVEIQVPSGTPRTDAMLNPENTYDSSHPRLAIGAM